MTHLAFASGVRRSQVVVVVDDRVINVTIYSKLVEVSQRGVSVKTFLDPKSALDWLFANQADLVITDYNMSGMNGATFVQRLRNLPSNADVPVVVITGRDDRNARLSSLNAGATDFLKAPVDHPEFVARVRNLLKMSWQHSVLRERAYKLEQELMAVRASNLLSPTHDGRSKFRQGYLEVRPAPAAVAYEPVVCLLTGSLVGLQAVDLGSPSLDGTARPAHAFGSDESSGVLHEVCLDAGRWPAFGCDIRVVMKIDAADLERPSLLELVSQALTRNGVAPASMQFEVRLSAANDLDDARLRRLDQLSTFGILFSVDGRGGLPLSQLPTGRFRNLKISSGWCPTRSRGVRGKGPWGAFGEFARALGLSLTADGVTSQGELRRARDQGCQTAQGRYFSSPLVSADVPRFVAEWRPSEVLEELEAGSGGMGWGEL